MLLFTLNPIVYIVHLFGNFYSFSFYVGRMDRNRGSWVSNAEPGALLALTVITWIAVIRVLALRGSAGIFVLIILYRKIWQRKWITFYSCCRHERIDGVSFATNAR